MRPFASDGNQSLGDGVLANVMPFLGEMLLIANARVKEIDLKPNAVSFRKVGFEVAYGFGKAARWR